MNNTIVLAQEVTELIEREDMAIEESVSGDMSSQIQNAYSDSVKENISVDINEIILLVVGAGIGFVASVGTILVQRLIDMKGKLNIFYRFTYQKGMGKTGGGSARLQITNCFLQSQWCLNYKTHQIQLELLGI